MPHAASPSESPTPSPADTLLSVDGILAVEAAIIGASLALLGFALVWALIKLSGREPAAMVTVTLGLLTLTAILTFALTESEILGTIAATGVGALAGAVTNLFDVTHRRNQARKKEELPEGSGDEPDDPPKANG